VITVRDVPGPTAVTPATRSRLRALHEAAFPLAERQYSMQDMLGRAGERNCIFRIVTLGQDVAGYLYLELSPETATAFLWYFTIDAALRNRGIGRLAIRDTLEMLRREHPDLRYAMFEVHKPLAADQAGRDLDLRRIHFYRGLGAFLVRGVDYRIPAADDRERSLTYEPMFFALHDSFDRTEIGVSIVAMARDNFESRPDDPRWLRLRKSIGRMTIVAPADPLVS